MTITIDRRGLVALIEGEEHLVGVRCMACGTHAFPPQPTCPRCGSATEPTALPARGTVWSWTVQRIRPKPPYTGPDEFEPFAVGYVDVGPLRVESRLEGKAAESWQIGDAVRLVPGGADDDGNVWSYRFVPDGGSA
jgi:uncharacterized OB-fold protein